MIRMIAGRCTVSPPHEPVTELVSGIVPTAADLSRVLMAADLRNEILLVFPRDPTIRSIQNEVADFYGINREYLRKPDMVGVREARISHPRQVAMFFARKFTHFSLPTIGKHFSRDHTTVMYAIRAVEKRAASDPMLEMELEVLRERFAA